MADAPLPALPSVEAALARISEIRWCVVNDPTLTRADADPMIAFLGALAVWYASLLRDSEQVSRLKAVLVPVHQRGRAIRGEGHPIPAPDYLTAEDLADRVAVIHGALVDARAKEPDATAFRVAEWIDCYLRYLATLTENTDNG